MRRMFANVGATKYIAGTSGNGGRLECSCLNHKGVKPDEEMQDIVRLTREE